MVGGEWLVVGGWWWVIGGEWLVDKLRVCSDDEWKD